MIAAWLNYFAGTGLCCARMKTATEHITGAAFPGRRSVGLFRACLRFTPPGVVDSAGRITELGRLTWPLVSPPRERSILAERKPRRLCPKGMVVRSYRHHGSASSLNEKAQPGKYRRPRNRDGPGSECFELVGVFSGRATESPGKLTGAALPTRHPPQFI